jgi:hypothetical protein
MVFDDLDWDLGLELFVENCVGILLVRNTELLISSGSCASTSVQ